MLLDIPYMEHLGLKISVFCFFLFLSSLTIGVDFWINSIRTWQELGLVVACWYA